MSIARFRHVAMPLLGAGNQPSTAWCKRPGCPFMENRQEGACQSCLQASERDPSSARVERTMEGPWMRWEQSGGLASTGARTLENDCSPEIALPAEAVAGNIRSADPLPPWGRPKPSEKKRVKASEGLRGVGGPSACARIAEITSGRAISQQGLATTCKDSSDQGRPEVGERDLAWRMSPWSEEGGVTPSERILEILSAGVTPRRGKGALGTWRARALHRTGHRTGYPDPRRERVEPRSKPHQPGAYARQRLSFGCCGKAPWGQARAANRTREIRPSGMKEGGLGKRGHGSRTEVRGESRGDTTGPYSARARVLSRPTPPSAAASTPAVRRGSTSFSPRTEALPSDKSSRARTTAALVASFEPPSWRKRKKCVRASPAATGRDG
jgi:hypothetical protein